MKLELDYPEAVLSALRDPGLPLLTIFVALQEGRLILGKSRPALLEPKFAKRAAYLARGYMANCLADELLVYQALQNADMDELVDFLLEDLDFFYGQPDAVQLFVPFR